MTPLRIPFMSCVVVLVLIKGPAVPRAVAGSSSGDYIRVTPQEGPTVQGPWTTSPFAAQQAMQPDGSFVLPAANDREYFRLLIEQGDALPFDSVLPIEDIPSNVLSRAQTFLETTRIDSTATNGVLVVDQEWDETVEIAPFAFPIYDPAVSEGMAPAYVDLKLVRNPPTGGDSGFLGRYGEENPTDAGFITLSLTEGDFPIVAFGSEGKSDVERLQMRAGSALIKAVRYGAGLMVAEGPNGLPMAFDGTSLYKFPADFVDHVDALEEGVAEDEPLEDESLVLSPLSEGLAHHETYAELKQDYLESPVYQRFRQERARAAEYAWRIENGDLPSGITLAIGEGTTVLRGEIDLLWTVEEEPAAELGTVLRVIANGAEGGLMLTGAGVGFAVVDVELPDGSRAFFPVEVIAEPRQTQPAGGGLPGGVEWINTDTYAGSWGDQSKFTQWKANEFCRAVGCGPTAYSILWAWHENWSHIDMPFGNPRYAGAPYSHGANWELYRTQKALHELCDTFCPPATDNGATFPWDMPEGSEGYLFLYRLVGCLGRAHGWAYEWPCNGFDDGAKKVRHGIKYKGVPAVLGVGFYSHYVVAYGYRHRRLVANNQTLWWGRYFKCNWGNGGDVKWVNGRSTFFGHWYQIWQKADYPLGVDFP